MWFGVLWWCFDDHLAAALEKPGLGELPIWVPFLIGIAFTTTVNVSQNSKDR